MWVECTIICVWWRGSYWVLWGCWWTCPQGWCCFRCRCLLFVSLGPAASGCWSCSSLTIQSYLAFRLIAWSGSQEDSPPRWWDSRCTQGPLFRREWERRSSLASSCSKCKSKFLWRCTTWSFFPSWRLVPCGSQGSWIQNLIIFIDSAPCSTA